MADQEGVDIRKYSVIYDAIEEVKAAMEGMLAPEVKEQITATIEIREVFNITKVGLVAGAMVKTGKVKRSDKARWYCHLSRIHQRIDTSQGRCEGCRYKLRVWYQSGELQRHEGRRYDRDIRRNRSETDAVNIVRL